MSPKGQWAQAAALAALALALGAVAVLAINRNAQLVEHYQMGSTFAKARTWHGLQVMAYQDQARELSCGALAEARHQALLELHTEPELDREEHARLLIQATVLHTLHRQRAQHRACAELSSTDGRRAVYRGKIVRVLPRSTAGGMP